MRIAQVSPLYESVPPKYYGGTERVVSYLTEELVRLGHDVTLYASGDSVTSARLVACCPTSLRLNTACVDQLAYHLVMLERVARESSMYDAVHNHCDYLFFPFSRHLSAAHVTTLHGRLDLPDLVPLYDEFREMPVVSISDSQREPLPWLQWRGTVHHGLPRDLYRMQEGAGGYLAFLGRVSPEKRVDRCIEIATRAGIPLKISAKVDNADTEYFESRIRPLLARPGVEWIGEIGESDKQEFLGNARAFLFPIDWPEPFGLVMIEAMACGTPVIAYDNGSVSEVIEDGLSGRIVGSIEQAVHAVEAVDGLSRQRCRDSFEARFTVEKMASRYVAIYEALMDQGTDAPSARVPPEELPQIGPLPGGAPGVRLA